MNGFLLVICLLPQKRKVHLTLEIEDVHDKMVNLGSLVEKIKRRIENKARQT